MFQKLISALFHFIHRSPGYRITPSSGESGDGPCNALINNLAGNRAIISHLFPEKGNWRRRASSGQAISAPCNYVLFFFYPRNPVSKDEGGGRTETRGNRAFATISTGLLRKRGQQRRRGREIEKSNNRFNSFCFSTMERSKEFSSQGVRNEREIWTMLWLFQGNRNVRWTLKKLVWS